MKTPVISMVVVVVAFASPAFGGPTKTVGYRFIDQRSGITVTVDALTARAAARLAPDGYIVELDGSKPMYVRLAKDGLALPSAGNIVADAGIFTGAAGLASVSAGSSGNLYCTQSGASVTCDLMNGITLSGGLSAANVTDSALTSGDCVQSTTGGLLLSAGGPCMTTIGGQSVGGTTTFSSSSPIALGNSTTNTITSAGLAGTTNITAGTIFQSTDSTNCTGSVADYLIAFENESAVSEMALTCKGVMSVNGSVTSGNVVTAQGTGSALVANSGNISASSSSAGVGEILSGGASSIAGALGSGSVIVGGTGLIASDATCNPTASNAASATVTLTNGVACVVTIGGTASLTTKVTMTYANSYNTAPVCDATLGKNTNGVTILSCVAGTSSAVITFSAAMKLNDTYNVVLLGGK